MKRKGFLLTLPTFYLLFALSTVHAQETSWQKIPTPCTFGSTSAMFATSSIVIASGCNPPRYTDDDGVSWKTIVGFTGDFKDFAVSSDGTIYSGTNHGVWKSSDDGITWEKTDDFFEYDDVTQIAINSKDDIFVISVGILFRSSNKGVSWDTVSADYQNDSPVLQINSKDEILLAVTKGTYNKDGLIYKSTDGGTTFDLVNDTDFEGISLDKMDLTENDDIYLATWGDGLFRSTDNGESWVSIYDESWGEYALWTDAILTYSNHLFISLSGVGVLRSVDQGETWTEFSTGLQKSDDHVRNPGAICIDAQGYLYGGSNGFGTYRTTNPVLIEVLGVKPDHNTFLASNYPNPFHNTTTLTYRGETNTPVILTILDQTGREISHVTMKKSNETYEWKFDGSMLSPGIYFYTVLDGDKKITNKMIIRR